VEACAQGAITQTEDSIVTDEDKCTFCGDCVQTCYAEAREIVGRTVTVVQVMAEIERDVAFYDESGGGVTFSGGEPLMQPDFLYALLQSCREKEIHTAVDTSGLAPWKTLQRISQYVNVFLYDLKLMDDEKHCRFTGVSNELILTNLQSLSQEGHTINVRVPIIPGINDDDENIFKLGEFVASLARPPQISILPYHKAGINKYARLNKTYTLPETQLPSSDRIAEIEAVLQGFGLQVKMGG
jgi:pyruvate formate lyase activating enzyme